MSKPKRTVQITLPSFRWKDLWNLHGVFILIIGLITFGAGYWWKAMRPYFPVVNAVLQVDSRELIAEQEGQLAMCTLEEGDCFSKGQTLFSFGEVLASSQLHILEEKCQGIRQKLHQEQAKLDQNMQQYLYLQNELEVEIGPTELTDQIFAQIQQQQEKIASMEQEIRKLEADQMGLHNSIARQTVVAPFEGMVLQRFKQVGEKVRAGDSLVLICDGHKRWVEAEIPETILSNIQLGIQTRIEFPAFPGKIWLGQVSWISPTVVGGKLKLRLTAENLPLRPGLSAKASLKIH